MADARVRIEGWGIDYSEERPHTPLGNLTPTEYAEQANQDRKVAQDLDQGWGQVQSASRLSQPVTPAVAAGQSPAISLV